MIESNLVFPSESVAVQLAGLSVQMQFGDYVKKQGITESRVPEYIPPHLIDLHRKSTWKQAIQSYHKKLIGVTVDRAKLFYVEASKSIPNISMRIFDMKVKDHNIRLSVIGNMRTLFCLLLILEELNS